MGWQDRDWARFTDADRRRFYGPGGAPYVSAFPSQQVSSHLVLAVIISAVLGIVGGAVDFGWTSLRHAVAKPAPVYGIRGADTATHWHTACTEASFNTSTNQWVCVNYALLRPDVPIATPHPLTVQPCGHAEVDQSGGVWICLGVAPPPPSTLPPSSAPGMTPAPVVAS